MDGSQGEATKDGVAVGVCHWPSDQRENDEFSKQLEQSSVSLNPIPDEAFSFQLLKGQAVCNQEVPWEGVKDNYLMPLHNLFGVLE